MSSFDGLASPRPIAELRGAAPLVVGSGWSGVISAGGGLPSGVTGTSCTWGVLWGAVCCAEVAVPGNAASTATISIADRSLFLMRCSFPWLSESTQPKGNLFHHYIEHIGHLPAQRTATRSDAGSAFRGRPPPEQRVNNLVLYVPSAVSTVLR